VSATQSPSIPYDSFEGRELWVPGVDSVTALGTFFLQAGNADFFRTYGTRILRGRGFDDHDGMSGTPVVVVSQSMAERLWPRSDAVGKCIHIGGRTAPCAVVVGVSEDMRIHSFSGRSSHSPVSQTVSESAPADAGTDYTYVVPIGQFEGPAGALLVRVAGDAGEYAEILRRRLQRVMPGAAYVTAAPLRNTIEPRMRSWRMGTTTFVAFAALAATLAGIGIFSVISYGVTQRRQEIGVRLALGASRGNVARLVVRCGLRLVCVGVALGIAVALTAAPWIAPLLFEESPTDPVVYSAVAIVLILVTLVATALPALAATRVGPNVALRTD
jgi:hypothetical protein